MNYSRYLKYLIKSNSLVSGRLFSAYLKAERDQLLQMKEAQYGTYQYFRDYQKELRTVSANVDTILGKDRNRIQGKEKAQDIS